MGLTGEMAAERDDRFSGGLYKNFFFMIFLDKSRKMI